MRKPFEERLRMAPAMANEAGSRQALSGPEAAYAQELFEKHRLSLYRYLHRVLHSRDDASEVLQETYLRLLRQPDFARLSENAKAYLFRTATNLARDVFRQRAMKGAQAEAEAFAMGGLDSPDWSSWPEFAIEGEQLCALLVEAVGQLDAAPRCALLLHRFRDMTHSQIAACMNLSERTIERYIKDALKHIADRLEEQR